MSASNFPFEDCLLKHFVRTDGWLPVCKNRRKIVNAGRARRLRYFTFCAVGAIDVLMLDVAKVLIKSSQDTFDTVCFFDLDADAVFNTRKNIPGADGIVGDFVDTVMADDPHFPEAAIVNGGEPEGQESMPLSSERPAQNTRAERERQRMLSARRAFIGAFPFDIVNLDLEQYLFQPTEQLPGRLINALRRVFEWQHRPRMFSGKPPAQAIDGFSLMFTTRIGPPNLGQEYLEMLRSGIVSNLEADRDLADLMTARVGHADVPVLERTSFGEFFKLAVPKLLARLLMERDWYVDPTNGIKIYEFERTNAQLTYSMLHFVMDVKQHEPPEGQRAPGVTSASAAAAYRSVVREVFSRREIVVTEAGLDKASLEVDLSKIKARRNKNRGGV